MHNPKGKKFWISIQNTLILNWTFLPAHAAKLKAYKKDVWVLLTSISNVNQKMCNIWQVLNLKEKWKIWVNSPYDSCFL